MKSIKIYLLPLFIFFSTPNFSQNDFYNKSKEKNKQGVLKTDSIVEQGYMTEKEYNQMHNAEKPQKEVNSKVYYSDEIYNDEEEQKRSEKRNNDIDEEAVSFFVEIVVGVLSIASAFW